MSVDPVAVLQGAANEALAQEFVEFLVSKEGQRVWNLKAGDEAGGRHALRRLPVRRDVYTAGDLARYSDPGELPYENTGGFVYRAELTAPAFNALALVVRAMCLDSHGELKDAWEALIEHGFPPQATAAFGDVSIAGYDSAMGQIRQTLKSNNRIAAIEIQKRLGESFRENYRRTISLARQGR